MTPAVKNCPICRNACPVESDFCSKCGSKLAPATRAFESSRLLCPSCGYQLGSFNTICPRCKSSALPAVVKTPNQPPVIAPTPNIRMQPQSAPLNQIPHIQCPSCRQWVPQTSATCLHCMFVLTPAKSLASAESNQAPVQQVIIQNSIQPPMPQYPYRQYNGYLSPKDKTTACLLSFFLGTFGAQHFYLRNNTAGILSIVFCWTYVPAIIGLVQGIMLICMSDQEFQARYSGLM